ITRYFWVNDKESIAYASDFFIDNHHSTYLSHDIVDIDNYCIIVYWRRPFLVFINLIITTGSAVLGGMMFGAYMVMLWSSFCIIKQIKQKPHMSERLIRLNIQLFRALVLQAIIPMLTAYTPIVLCCFLPLIGFSIPIFSVFCPPFCALHPVLDSCIMLATVSQFRKTLVECILCRLNRRNSQVNHREFEFTEHGRDVRLRRRLSDAY
ncbi:hypothetical protein PMAYCL1PPCAC_08424, partial [Pristionchus mayeri]